MGRHGDSEIRRKIEIGRWGDEGMMRAKAGCQNIRKSGYQRPQARDERSKAGPKDLSSHLNNGMGRRDLLRTSSYALENCIAAPDTVLTVYLLENFFVSFIP
jgi:hypothetical protein